MKEKIIIIGGGPAGLFCSFQLLKFGFEVDLYDQMPGVGAKFIIAGKGGLNLTHSEEIDIFCTRYGKDQKLFKELLEEFSPTSLRAWSEELGVKTFIGTSGRVFPENVSAAQMLSIWLNLLKSNTKFNLFLNHQLINISKEKMLTFKTKNKTTQVQASKIIVALGGASYQKTGSNGKWKDIFEKLGIETKPFLPMNCGFERPWSKYFISNVDRRPLKNISVKIENSEVKGEVMLTPYGIEGGAIYAISNVIRNHILKKGKAIITLDLRPDLKIEIIQKKLKTRRHKDSLGNYLRKTLNLDKYIHTLIRELSDSTKLENSEYLASQIKGLDIELFSTRPLSEAISTSGGVCFSSLTDNLEVREIPGLYVAGEMLDFEAPTGGYLLQGCFTTAWRIIKSLTHQ